MTSKKFIAGLVVGLVGALSISLFGAQQTLNSPVSGPYVGQGQHTGTANFYGGSLQDVIAKQQAMNTELYSGSELTFSGLAGPIHVGNSTDNQGFLFDSTGNYTFAGAVITTGVKVTGSGCVNTAGINLPTTTTLGICTFSVLRGIWDASNNAVPIVAASTTSETNGFLYYPGASGVPTGVPANLAGNYANSFPTYYDSAHHRMYAYDGAAWHNIADSATAPVLSGTTGSIGGGALTAGQCTSGTVAVAGSTNAMAVSASPVADPGTGFTWGAFVSSAGTVTVRVCAVAAGTPTTSNYNVRVQQ